MPPAPPSRRAPWPVLSLAVMSLAVFFSITTEVLPTGLLPSMSRSLGVSPGKLGLLVTAYALVVAVLAAPLGIATARFARRPLLTATLVGYASSNAVMALSSSYALAIGARLIGGLSHALFWAMLGGYVARMVSPERVGRAVTLVSSGGLLAVLFGVPAGTALGVAIGWRPTYVILAVAPVLLIVLGWRALPDLPGTTGGKEQRLAQVARIPGLVPVVVVTAVTMLGQFTFSTYVAPFLLHVGLAEEQISPVLLASGVAGGLGLLATGVFIDRRLRAGMLIGTAALGTALAVLAFGPTSVALVVAGICVTGVAMGSIPVFVQTATLRARARRARCGERAQRGVVQPRDRRWGAHRRYRRRPPRPGGAAGDRGDAGRCRFRGHRDDSPRPPGPVPARRRPHPVRFVPPHRLRVTSSSPPSPGRASPGATFCSKAWPRAAK
ncbi:putative MFS family arabinose efflux permease [Allocatelliglobosispora scoriae]|uniref:Putative MFS family arabinose efflux permease n=1 Tax=Allocatelliglobosispora scoriae TaxID=643052 RepID=A0A841BMY6_9ACTN|nr:MFS transporter [Allocatelliglobosispora scoriae]MBB5869035.1 putative MFS family arabinose efflux permease [Allocatelliglobosispora scoriae]